ncbi:MAG: metallophosphoesterase [Pseudomonadales bacterium]
MIACTYRPLLRAFLSTLAAAQLVLAATVAGAAPSPAAVLQRPARVDAFEYQNVDTVVAIGDVHGAIDELQQLLRGAGLIDGANRWTGGKTHLVSLGDLIDRGDATRPVLDLLMRLQEEAVAAGGAVHVLMGNHELLNLTGDWRDVSPADLASFDSADARREAFYRFGTYGDWLLRRPVLIKINQRLFTHGGLSSLLLDGPLAKTNDVPMNLLKAMVIEAETLIADEVIAADTKLLSLAEQPRQPGEDPSLRRLRGMVDSPYFADNGPLWYRGTSGCEATIEADLTNAVLQHLDASSVVVGHSPTWNHRVRRLQGGKVWAIDTGMLASAYRGKPYAVRWRGEQVEVLDASGASVPWADEVFAQASAAQLAAAQARMATYQVVRSEAQPETPRPRRYRKDQLVQVTDANGEPVGNAWFRELGKRDVRKELAAWQLDRLLGLGLVPDTFAAALGKDRGIVMLMDSLVLTEQQRLDQDRAFANWCERGNGYQAVTVFDALIHQRDRDSWNLAYEHRLTKIRLTDHADSFGSASKPAKPKVPLAISETLRGRLAALTQETLTEQLGELLSKREIKALLRRRDVIVRWPGLPGA